MSMLSGVTRGSALSVATTLSAGTPTSSSAPSIKEQELREKDVELATPNVEQNCEPSYPEGGRQAWAVVFGSWCSLFSALGIMNTMGSYEAYISKNQLIGYSPGDVGWIFSMYAFLTFGGGIIIGPAFDKYGPRWLILGGSIGVSLSMLLLGNCQVYWHFMVVFGVLGGLGSALIFSPSLAIIRHYFMARQGAATGIAATGGAIGGIIFPLMLQYLIPSIGFNIATKAIGAITAFLCILSNIFIRPRLPPGGTIWPDVRIFRDVTFSTTVLGVFLLEFALFIPLTYISSSVTASGFSTAFSYNILMFINLGSVFGRALPGFLADRIGHYNAAILAIALTVISVLSIWLPAGDSKAGLIMFALLFGFGSGSNISLTPVCVSQLCPVEKIGRYIATCYATVSVGCLIGVPIAGQILSSGHTASVGYRNLILFVGFCYVGGLVAFSVARVMAKGWKVTQKF
ncbi:riboflavin transporter [Phlyctema vagabunda]|uniref:Riboflavin transporter n=1 Tax=Phlyctema vagabunda TaxID=108571 RepID=A0ABR4PGV9_9HELO